ncbi:MAG TPA: type IV secretion system DNA-binding domain-containing protein, partial [Gammaproteobacteria bacterium]|nr:type IV secretion system DNA-binding domain-containing protein [Gammaproteobacteria bacterium]
TVIFLIEKGRRQLILENIRGSAFLEPKHLKLFLEKQNKKSDLMLGDVPLVKGSETQHILVTGTTGSGKSVCMMALMDGVRRRRQRAIVYDVVGTFIQHYYRPDRDIILNPLDMRCPSWNIWQEGQDVADFEAHAASLMPLNSGYDPFWIHSARTIFSTLAEKLQQNHNTKTKALLTPMFAADLNLLNRLLKGTVAENLVNETVEKMAQSIKSTVTAYCKCLRYLKAEGTEPLFSIKRWLQAENHDGWIFIASNTEKLEAIKPLISLWLDIAARGILTLQPSFDRRIWFLIDELASLQPLPSLSLLLSQGRKYGACTVTAFQDIHQLRSIYGREDAEALSAMYNTNLCYRTKCPDTAQWMSRIVGQREVVEKKEGFSYGANDIRDGVSMHQERRKEALVLESEFLKLNDCEAYLILPENVPITKIKLLPKKRAILAPMWLPRAIQPFSTSEETLKPKILKAATPQSSTPDKTSSESQELKKPVASLRKTKIKVPMSTQQKTESELLL